MKEAQGSSLRLFMMALNFEVVDEEMPLPLAEGFEFKSLSYAH